MLANEWGNKNIAYTLTFRYALNVSYAADFRFSGTEIGRAVFVFFARLITKITRHVTFIHVWLVSFRYTLYGTREGYKNRSSYVTYNILRFRRFEIVYLSLPLSLSLRLVQFSYFCSIKCILPILSIKQPLGSK